MHISIVFESFFFSSPLRRPLIVVFDSGPDPKEVERAKNLAEDLIAVVREEWQKAKAVIDQYSASLNVPQYYAGYQGYSQPVRR
jgi:hypothetical protein